jgi:hypothetical protein
MSATAVKKQKKIVVHEYYARGREETLVRRPQVDQQTPLGRQIRLQDAVRYSFAPDGRLSVAEGQDMLADGPLDPETMEPTMQDAVAWLESHSLRNVRFWEEGKEPDRPLPTEEDFLEAVTAATAGLQVEPLQELLEAERGSHARPVLLKAAERAVDQVEKITATMAEQAAEGSPPAA